MCGTLRDALSSRYAELLAEGAADAESLDLPALLRGDLGSTAGPGLHPVQERVAVLADLEAWHLAAGRREAALEARMTWLQGLYDAFPGGEDRRLIRREITARLAGFRDVPWWSMGMAALARLQMQEEEPGHLAGAHAAAVAGRDAWPGSSGGDSATSFFCENLPAGEHTLKYRLRANLAGEFRVGPATLQSMYAPELVAYSGAAVIRVGDAP